MFQSREGTKEGEAEWKEGVEGCNESPSQGQGHKSDTKSCSSCRWKTINSFVKILDIWSQKNNKTQNINL